MAEGFKSNQFHEMRNEKVNLCLQSYAGLLVYGKSPSGLVESGHLWWVLFTAAGANF